MARKKLLVAHNAEDLAEILGLTPADAQEWELRAQLAARIAQEIKRRKLTHAQAAKLAGTSRSRMTAIINGGLPGVSTDLLLRILSSFGLRAKVTFSRAA